MNRSRSGYVYIALCAVIFSTMEVMLKTVHGVFAPMQITCLRFLVGGILLIPFASRSMKKKNASLSRKDIGFFALSGFLCIVIAMSLYQMSVTYTRASIVAVIFSCNPIFVTVFAHLFLHEDIHRNHIIALILELTAALIIIDPIHATLDPTGSVLAILSAVMFALYSVFGKKRTPRFGGIAVTCLSFLFGAGELVFILLFGRTAAGASLYGAVGLNLFIDVPLFENIPASAIPALLYICCINSAAGFVCHMMAMEKTSAQEASLIFFLKPILAPIFVASALDSGLALLVLALLGLRARGVFETTDELLTSLAGLLCTCIAVDAYLIGCEILTTAYNGTEGGMAVINTLLFGGTAPFFWFEVICGLIIPFCLLVFAKNRRNMKVVGVASALVVAGVFCKRCWLMFTGFAVPNIVGGNGITLGTTAAQAGGAADMWTLMGTYAPTVPEIVLTVGIFALGICAFTVLCQKLLKK